MEAMAAEPKPESIKTWSDVVKLAAQSPNAFRPVKRSNQDKLKLQFTADILGRNPSASGAMAAMGTPRQPLAPSQWSNFPMLHSGNGAAEHEPGYITYRRRMQHPQAQSSAFQNSNQQHQLQQQTQPDWPLFGSFGSSPVGRASNGGGTTATSCGSDVPAAATAQIEHLRAELTAAVQRERLLINELEAARKGKEQAVMQLKSVQSTPADHRQVAATTAPAKAEQQGQQAALQLLRQQSGALEEEMATWRERERQAGMQLNAVSTVARQMAQVLDSMSTQQASTLDAMVEALTEYQNVADAWAAGYDMSHATPSPGGPGVEASPGCGPSPAGNLFNTPQRHGHGGMDAEERDGLLQQIWQRDQLVQLLASSVAAMERAAKKGNAEGANLLAKIIMLSVHQPHEPEGSKGHSDDGSDGGGSGPARAQSAPGAEVNGRGK